MPAAFKRGDQVRIKVPTIQGTVEQVRPGDELMYVVRWVDANGAPHHRELPESMLELVVSGKQP